MAVPVSGIVGFILYRITGVRHDFVGRIDDNADVGAGGAAVVGAGEKDQIAGLCLRF